MYAVWGQSHPWLKTPVKTKTLIVIISKHYHEKVISIDDYEPLLLPVDCGANKR